MDVQVVGRFVKQQEVGLADDGLGQGHSCFFAATEYFDLFIGIVATKQKAAQEGAQLQFRLLRAGFLQLIEDGVIGIAGNAGRSCLNASGVWTPKNADKIASAIAQRLAEIKPLPADHPDAKLAIFANPTMAERMNAMIEGNMNGGAVDVCQQLRGTPRLHQEGRCTWLLPTIIRCDREHTLSNKEFLFPFASVIECPLDEIPESIGTTLVGTVITSDKTFQRAAMACGNIDRLNMGPVPTIRLTYDQPHEGNLFEHLYRQRAFQLEPVA